MKVCVNCKHSYEFGIGTSNILCRKGGIDPIYGFHDECFDMRKFDGACGEGKLFEPKPDPKPTLWKRLFG